MSHDIPSSPHPSSTRGTLPTNRATAAIHVDASFDESLQDSTKKDTATIAAAKDIAFGSIAGSVGKIIEYPFDTVKVRLQSQPDGEPLRYKGPIDCFRQSLAGDSAVGGGTGGWRGLYRGVSAPMVGAAVETSCLFFSYRLAQSFIRSTMAPAQPSTSSSPSRIHEVARLPLSSLLACGALSGAFTSLALTPIELVKCQMQVPGPQPSSAASSAALGGRAAVAAQPTIVSLITSIYKTHGLLGLWRGQLGTLIRETGGSAAWFGSYEGVSLLFRRLQEKKKDINSHPSSSTVSSSSVSPGPLAPLPTWQQMLAGACAGMSYNLIFFPADTIKSRMQTDQHQQQQQHPSTSQSRQGHASTTASAPSPRKTFLAVGRSLWRARGIRGLYQGCGITVARSAPSSAFIFAIYEALKDSFA